MLKYGRLNDEKSREILRSDNDLLVAISYVFFDFNKLILRSTSNNILITNIKYFIIGFKSFLKYNSFQNFFDGKGVKFYFFNSFPLNNSNGPKLWIPVIPFFLHTKKRDLGSLKFFLDKSIISKKELIDLKALCKNLDRNYLLYGNDIYLNTFNNLLLRWVRIKYPSKRFISEHHGHPYLTENYPKLIVDVALATTYIVPNRHMYLDIVRIADKNLLRIPNFEVAEQPSLKHLSTLGDSYDKSLIFLPAFTLRKNHSSVVGKISAIHLKQLINIVNEKFPLSVFKIHPANTQIELEQLGILHTYTNSNDFTQYKSIVVLSHCSTLLTEIEQYNLQKRTHVFYDMCNRFGIESEKSFYLKGYHIITYKSSEYYD